MPTIPRETLLCRYRYDPLDRLVDTARPSTDNLQRFYCKNRLATEIKGATHYSVFRHDDQLLAQQQHRNANIDTTLLATDQQRSVLNALNATHVHPLTYSPYGHRPPLANALFGLLGFNGEPPDPVTGDYILGNGYRAFNPVLMRFNSPDSLSPFGKGGLNAYGYCLGDPVNHRDPNGHIPVLTVVSAVSGVVALASFAGSLFTDDKTLASVLKGISLAALGVGLVGLVKLIMKRPRPPGLPELQRNEALQMQPLGPNRHTELPPGYFEHLPTDSQTTLSAPPPYSLHDPANTPANASNLFPRRSSAPADLYSTEHSSRVTPRLTRSPSNGRGLTRSNTDIRNER